LPPFPKPTHGPPGSGLLPYRTVRMCISNIPPEAPDHDVQGTLSRGLRMGPREPFNPNSLARTVTCGGGEFNYHPSGQRRYTNRELACLQTFPLSYKFRQREVKKQIGNAVPPLLSKAIFREIIKSLQRTDEAEVRELEQK
jgi:DNA (cytosine-5)-methyltransferase 1